jgi:serine/threonine-protein kinase
VGRYEVVRLIGEGSMGRVLLAHDPVLDRDVAVKHLRSDLKIPRDVRQGLITRMRHEARAAARVPHPNLVVLHDMGEDPGIGLYLVFEYVEGPTLKQRLLEGRLPPAEVARLAKDLGAALTVAHEAGILHRDVKPENVILSKTGGKIADFGIARIPDSTLTHQGGLMGTPAYSAPETFRAGKFSPASDQFSLAASIYEALSGRRAFPGEDAVAVAARITHETPEPFAAELDLPLAVDEVIGRGLARNPEDRFPSAGAFGAALAEALAPEAAEAPATTPVRPPAADGTAPPAPPRERRTGQVVLGAAVVVATAALLVRAAVRSSEASSEEGMAAPGVPMPMVSARAARPRPPAPSSRPARPRPEPPASAGPSAGAPSASSSASSSAAASAAVSAAASASASASAPAPASASASAVPAADAGAPLPAMSAPLPRAGADAGP